MTDVMERNINTAQTIGSTVAAIGLEKTGHSVAGNLVTPAVWAANYAVNGNVPSSVDVSIYGAGFISAPASIAVGVFKAVMDDDINRKVEDIKVKQDPMFRQFIYAVQNYSGLPPFIAALKIAENGGTAWRGHNNQWVYITDSNGLLLTDYEPKGAVQTIRPVYPFKEKNGKFDICSKTCR